MPSTPTKSQLLERIVSLQSALDGAFALAMQSSGPLSYGLGEDTYASLYNSLRAQAEEITGEEPPMPRAPDISDAGGRLGVVSALKVLTGQLALWLRHTLPKAQP